MVLFRTMSLIWLTTVIAPLPAPMRSFVGTEPDSRPSSVTAAPAGSTSAESPTKELPVFIAPAPDVWDSSLVRAAPMRPENHRCSPLWLANFDSPVTSPGCRISNIRDRHTFHFTFPDRWLICRYAHAPPV